MFGKGKRTFISSSCRLAFKEPEELCYCFLNLLSSVCFLYCRLTLKPSPEFFQSCYFLAIFM